MKIRIVHESGENSKINDMVLGSQISPDSHTVFSVLMMLYVESTYCLYVLCIPWMIL
jgi:hypothetical protein